MKKWQCIVCGYVYDEATGDPDHGIKAGTRLGRRRALLNPAL